MAVRRTQKLITIETHQQTLIRSRRKALIAWCQQCGAQTLMLPPEQAATMNGTTERIIFGQIENGDLHFIETKTRELLVCRNALELSQKRMPQESSGRSRRHAENDKKYEE